MSLREKRLFVVELQSSSLPVVTRCFATLTVCHLDVSLPH